MADQSFDAIMKDLRAGVFAPVYLLHGEETYFIDKVAAFIEANALGESERVFNQLICYGKETDARSVIDTARQYPMMSQRRVILIKEAQAMRDLEALEPYVAKPAESTVLVICHMHKKLDGRKALSKAAKKHAVVFESKRLYENQVAPWIETYLRRKKVQIDPVAALALVEYLGNDLSKVSNELDKLLLQLGDTKQVTEADVFDNIGVSKDFNVFELQKALGMRDPIRIERIVQHFVANMRSNPLVLITANLFSYFTKLLITRAMGNATDKELAAALGLRSAFFLKEYKAAARMYSTADLEKIIGVLRKYDLQSKGVGNRSKSEPELLREMIQSIYYVGALPSVPAE